MKRPSRKELFQKIKAAKKAVNEGRVIILDDQEESIISDALELGYDVEDEILNILSDLLAQTKPENYQGGTPPDKSYEKEIKGFELFAFKVRISSFNCKIYYKFVIRDDDLWLIFLHKDKKRRKNHDHS